MADEDWVRRRLEQIMVDRGIPIPRVDAAFFGEVDPDRKATSEGGLAPPMTELEALILDLRAYIVEGPAVKEAMLRNLNAESVSFSFDNAEPDLFISADTLRQDAAVANDVRVIIDGILREVRANNW